jgi:hypothetical protein
MPRVLFCSFLPLVFALVSVEAKPKSNNTVGFVGKQATSIQNKRVTPNQWSGSKSQSQLLNKKFPIQKWDSHFSSVGSKRSAIEVKGKDGERKLFKTETKTFPKKEYGLSRWNERIKDLHKDAQIVEDAQPLKKAADEQMYRMMLQDSSSYADLGAELSLRDLNKFQFRRNRSSGEVPVQAAGSGQ